MKCLVPISPNGYATTSKNNKAMNSDDDEDFGGGGGEEFKEPHRQLTSMGYLHGLEAGMQAGEINGLESGYLMESSRAFEFGRLLGLAKTVVKLKQSENAQLCFSLNLLIKRLEQCAQAKYWSDKHEDHTELELRMRELKQELENAGVFTL